MNKKELPLSGSEPTFTFRKWNSQKGVGSNNCYAYAFGSYNENRLWKSTPGESAGLRNYSNYTKCGTSADKVVADNPKKVYKCSAETKCKPGHYKVMMFVAGCDKKNGCLKAGDFHFYKQHGKVEYKIKKGDTLESIAAFFKIPVLRVKRAAGGSLRVGKKIILKCNLFSHKRGWATGALLKDAKGKMIKDPRLADKNYPSLNYNTYCSSFCVKNRGVKVGHTYTKVRKKTV